MLHASPAEAAEQALPRELPQVFVRAFAAPPGPPWEQARSAMLEARHGAPLPIADLMFKVRRLEPWRPGAPARYGAFYVRLREYVGPFETTVEVDGKAHGIAFGADRNRIARLRGLAVAGASLAASVLFVVIGVSLALAARESAQTKLDFLDQQSAQRLRAARTFDQSKRRLSDFENAAKDGARLGEVIGDLAWVAAAKAPEAQIVAVHWDRGVLGVEARGPGAPFSAPDRRIDRFEKPLRAGVWLWTVDRPGSGRIKATKGVEP